jgi:hypothetical protein
VLFPSPPLAGRLYLRITTTIASATIQASASINFDLSFHPHIFALLLVAIN